MKIKALALLAAAALFNSPLDAHLCGDGCEADCYGSVQVYGWLPWHNGDITLQGITADVKVGLDDAARNSDTFAIWGVRMELQRNRLGGFLDVYYGTYDRNNLPVPDSMETVNVDLTMTRVVGAIRYRLFSMDHDNDCRETRLDIYGGAVYYRYGADYVASGGSTGDLTIDWVDPIFGLNFARDIIGGWDAVLSGHVGGFGVGSDLSWEGWGGIVYRSQNIEPRVEVSALWRAAGVNYSKGSGANQNALDMIHHGPVLSVGMAF